VHTLLQRYICTRKIPELVLTPKLAILGSGTAPAPQRSDFKTQGVPYPYSDEGVTRPLISRAQLQSVSVSEQLSAESGRGDN
jgi:hypothetical protein